MNIQPVVIFGISDRELSVLRRIRPCQLLALTGLGVHNCHRFVIGTACHLIGQVIAETECIRRVHAFELVAGS